MTTGAGSAGGSDRARPVFFDPTGRRRKYLAVLAVGLATAVVAWVAAFALSLYYLSIVSEPVTETSSPHAPTQSASNAHSGMRRRESNCFAGRPETGGAASPAIYARLPSWPQWGLVSLRRHCDRVNGLLPQWYSLSYTEAAVTPLDTGEPHMVQIAEIIAENRSSVVLMPVVDASGYAQPGKAVSAFQSEQWISGVTDSIAATVSANGYDGICIDFSGVPASAFSGVARLFEKLKTRLQGSGGKTCLVAPLSEALWEHDALKPVVDRMIVLAFQEPGRASPPGPLASQAWFTDRINAVREKLDPSRTIIALGGFAYDWTSGEPAPRRVPYLEILRQAGLADGEIRLDPNTLNNGAEFMDAGGRRHQAWMLDAVSVHNQLRALAGDGFAGLAVWSLGEEDPQIWDLIGDGAMPPAGAAAILSRIDVSNYVGYRGDGAFEQVSAGPVTGIRRLRVDPASGLITGQSFKRLPRPYTLERYGMDGRNLVSITFDDGPDQRFTSQVLDVLEAYKVPAAFFVIGRNALRIPETVERIADAGHEIGVHTFFHPDIERVSDLRRTYEINATQRLISVMTGRRTRLFRLPYGRASGPVVGAQAAIVEAMNEEGYLVVGTDISPPDWKATGSAAIAAHVSDAVLAGKGNVIVLHDAGGDRGETVEALPAIIETLRRNGYEFVPLGELVGQSRDDVMPVDTGPRLLFDSLSFAAVSSLGKALVWLFWITILLGIARVLSIVTLAHLRRRHLVAPQGYAPPVTVIVPAYCEETVIEDCIAAVLASDYPELRVIAVDDGSTDATLAVLQARFGNDRRVRIISQSNRGKFAALDHAYGHVKTDIIVAIDADTFIDPGAVRQLVRHFADPRVGAVAGNVKVGNRHNLLTSMQSLEYITAQNLDRRAFERFNGILVVPGAIGAWRREAVAAAGFYTASTLAEDADLTVSVIQAGYRVVYEDRALAETEVPETIGQFLRQRLRWTLGMMQTGWKHRGAIREGRAVGLVSITDILVFGVMMPLIAPLADLLFLGTMADFAVDRFMRPVPLGGPSQAVIAGYVAFICADLLLAMIAFRLEPTESWWPIALVPLQRFFYRQLLYISAIRAAARALSGRMAEWRKVTRVIHSDDAAPVRAARRIVGLERPGPADSAGADAEARPVLTGEQAAAALRQLARHDRIAGSRIHDDGMDRGNAA
jgi:cellulose synthase/poly-beta-1,6-N-acetylglucosamine synthase-like glycosyltransferase/peptidoglycan/xylan/chitin deacetylase (PgdA/CDA1 family)